MRKLSVVVVVGQAVPDLQLGVITKKSQDSCGNPFCYPPAFITFAKLKNDCDLPNYGGRAPSLVREGWEGY